jgi:tetratricopeptide (TPR) repeat protein
MKYNNVVITLLALATLCPPALAQRPSKEYSDALRAGAQLANDRKYAEAQASLETALKAAANGEQRTQVYQRLVPVYRQLPEIDKFLEAQDFNIRHAERRDRRSNAASDVASFLHQRGKLDAGIARYEAALKTNPKDPAALGVLTVIFSRAREDKARAATLTAQLEALDRELGTALARRLEKDADAAPQTAASLLKDAASAWLEAGDKAKALAAAKKSLAQPPEQRSTVLTYFWRNGLGDVFLAAGEPALAVQQFEAALPVAPTRQSAEKKLAEARAAAEKKP